MTRWASEPVVEVTNALAGVSFTPIGPPIYVQDWWGCIFEFDALTAPGGLLHMVYGELSPDRSAIDPNRPSQQLNYHVQINTPLVHAQSHLGPYLQCFASQGLGPPTGQYNFKMRHTNRQERSADIQAFRNAGGPGQLVAYNVTFAAGANTVPIPSYVGPAYVSAFFTDPAIALQLQVSSIVSAAGPRTVDLIYGTGLALPQYDSPREIWLGGRVNSFLIQNSAGHDVDGAISLTPAFR